MRYLLFLAALWAAPVFAQVPRNCADHAIIVERLAGVYGEARQAIGMTSGNAIIEIFASTETGTWSITLTQAGGPTCLVASGVGYQALSEDLPAMGEDA